MGIFLRISGCLVVLLALLVGCAVHLWPHGFCERTCPMIERSPTVNEFGEFDVCESASKLEDLTTRGYAVLTNVLTRTERRRLLSFVENADFQQFASKEECPLMVGIDAFAKEPKLRKLIQKLGVDVARSTQRNIVVSSDAGDNGSAVDSFFFFLDRGDPKLSSPLPWHQDMEPYYLEQDLHNYLTVFIALEKHSSDIGGFSVVPFDRMHTESPDLHAMTVGRGATVFATIGNASMKMTDQEHDRRYKLNFHLDNMSCQPEVSAGDALVFRGDALYRTRPDPSSEIWLSLRIRPAKRPFRADKLLEGGYQKYEKLWKNQKMYVNRMRCALKDSLGVESLHGEVSKVQLWTSFGFYSRAVLYFFRRAMDIVMFA